MKNFSVLLLESIHKNATTAFKKNDCGVTSLKTSLSHDDLVSKLRGVQMLGIRSKTSVDADIITHASELHSVGAFCIGTNQIDLVSAAKHGVAVFNAPYSNTRSVVELAIGTIIMLNRGVCDKSMELHQGVWDKSARGSFEVRGKTLGIVGYGKIGSQLSVIAESLGMNVQYYDIEERLALGNATKCKSLVELLASSDVVTVHVDGRKENTSLFGKKEFARMKKGSLFINLSRGHIVDVQSCADAVRAKHIRGCAFDVYPTEPKGKTDDFKTELQGLPNVILTPHIGGSTEEAQRNIAEFVSQKLLTYMQTGDTSMSVNFPNVTVPALTEGYRFIHIHENVPGVLADINNTLAKRDINITAQYLATNEHIGYVVTDTNKKDGKELLSDLQAIPHTVRVRMIQ
jgi:D-3-phosphoglycerate dehydrogenase